MKLPRAVVRVLNGPYLTPESVVELQNFDDQVPPSLRRVIPQGFNPAWISLHGSTTVAIRQTMDSVAFLSCTGRLSAFDSGIAHRVNVDELQDQHSRQRPVAVKDPKFFEYRGEVWVTFNTGHPPNPLAPNDLYLGVFKGADTQPYRAVIPGRSRIEKNWGFFEHAGRLRALYSVDPVTVVDLVSIDEDRREFHFAQTDPVGPEVTVGTSLPRSSVLNIGSQPLWQGDQLVFTAHEKHYSAGKFRNYLPRIVTLRFHRGEVSTASLGKRMVHSFTNLFEPSHGNPFAFGVTYASGLQDEQGRLVLGYGFSDSNYPMVELPDSVIPVGQS